MGGRHLGTLRVGEGGRGTFREESPMEAATRAGHPPSRGKDLRCPCFVVWNYWKQSKLELLEKVDEAVGDVETSRKTLEEALEREKAADRAKLAIEEAFRRWRSEHGQKRRSVINSTKFKNYSSTPHRRGSQMLDVNGLSLVTGGSRSMVGPTLSIGQILSRKLMAPEIFETHVAEGIKGKPKVSLGQILSKKLDFLSPSRIDDGTTRKNFSARRKKFGFAVFSLLLVKQNKNKKKKKNQAWNPQLSYIVKHK